MNITVAGGSGFIGEALVRHLMDAGHDVSVLTRNPQQLKAGRPLLWDGTTGGPWSREVAKADAVINLAGENIGDGRWTAARRQRLINSRVNATRALIGAFAADPGRARTFVSASAVGYYGIRGEEEVDENGSRGAGFLADMAARWEEEARAAETLSRLVILRFGVVLDAEGGALAKMLLPFKLGVGGRIGSGEQWMSWIARDDVVRLIAWVIANPARGVYNATAPQPVRNRDFTKALGKVLRRPTIFPIPGLALKIAFGDMAGETLIGGQRVVPNRAVREGFRFTHDTVHSALEQALQHS